MTDLDKINLIGTLASIGSAIASFVIFLLNRTIRNQIIGRRRIETYSTFLAKSSATIDKIKKFTATDGKAQSLALDKFVLVLREYYELIKSIERALTKDHYRDLPTQSIELEKYIQDYSRMDNSTYRSDKEKLNSVYFKVIAMQNNIRAILDKKIE